jgi:hypothetical protein
MILGGKGFAPSASRRTEPAQHLHEAKDEIASVPVTVGIDRAQARVWNSSALW